MKNILKILLTILISGAFVTSCVDEESNYDALTMDPDPNAPFYVQFIDAAKNLETGVTESGELVNIETTVAVSLMGMPQNQEVAVNFAVDPSTTIGADMYTLSASSITIPSGGTSGSVNFATIAEKMPVGETVKLVLNLDAGDNNSPSETGTQLTYNLKRIEFCPLENGAADLVGSWSGMDGQGDYNYSANLTSTLNGVDLDLDGLGVGFINDFWGEAVIDGGTCTITINGNGTLTIPRQYLFTTEWEGAPYDYEIAGSGKWENCGDKPKLIIDYDIYYPGDTDGLAKTYSSYLGGVPYLTADITQN